MFLKFGDLGKISFDSDGDAKRVPQVMGNMRRLCPTLIVLRALTTKGFFKSTQFFNTSNSLQLVGLKFLQFGRQTVSKSLIFLCRK